MAELTQAEQVGYLYGSMHRAMVDFAKAFTAGFERGKKGPPLTPEEVAALRERRQVAEYRRRIEREREKGRRFVDGLLADLRREVIR